MVSLASANALSPVRAGILQCQGGQNVGFVVGSVTSLECVFQSAGRRPEPYIATVRRFGVDLGFTQQTQFSWAVNAPDSRLARGELAGNYGGVGANASVGIGGGGNFLVGGPAQCLRAAADQRAGPDRDRMSRPALPISTWSRTGPATVDRTAITAIVIIAAEHGELRRVNERGPRKRAFFVCGRSARQSGPQRGKSGTAADVVA